jgi:hypothetical protein
LQQEIDMTDETFADAGEIDAPRAILRIEALGVMAAACALYHLQGYSWQTFAIFFLLPDISMLGYAFGKRFGAAVYNVGHSYAIPAMIGAGGLALKNELALMAAIIWVAHIGFDRALGYGLKYPDAFRHTHLSS